MVLTGLENSLVSGHPDWLLLDQQQADRHDDHSSDETEKAIVPFAVSAAGGKKLVEADVDHNSGDRGKAGAHDLGSNFAPRNPAQTKVADGGADGFGKPAQKRVGESLGPASRGIEKGNGDANSLRNVVKSDGDGNGHAHLRAFKSCEKRGQSLGKVVQGDGEGGEHGHAQEFFLVPVRDGGVGVMQGG